jgi:low affinity Fe/Cu permease
MSRVLQSLDAITSRVSATVVVVIILLAFNVVLAARGFLSSWQVDFATASNTVVLIFLFSFKHTEHRGLTALQLKLDEVIRALPEADDHLVQIERAEESEIGVREKEKSSVHESLRGVRDDEEIEPNDK